MSFMGVCWLLALFSCFLDYSLCLEKIALVYSYESYTSGHIKEENGFLGGLRQYGFFENVNVEIDRFNMNGFTESITHDTRLSKADEIIDELNSTSYDAIAYFDDYAIYYVALEYKNSPGFFCGMNQLIEIYNASTPFLYGSLTDPTKSYLTGVWESRYLFQMLNFMSIIFPISNGVMMIILDSNTISEIIYGQIFKEYEEERTNILESFNITLESVFVSSVEELIEVFDMINSNDSITCTMNSVHSIVRTSDNVRFEADRIGELYYSFLNKPDFHTADFYIKYGMLGGAGSDFTLMGYAAGRQVGSYLSGEKNVGEFPIEFKSGFTTFLNLDRVEKLGYSISEEFLNQIGATFRFPVIPPPSFDYTMLFMLIFYVCSSICLILCFVCCFMGLVLCFSFCFSLYYSQKKKKEKFLDEVIAKISALDFENDIIDRMLKQTKKNNERTFFFFTRNRNKLFPALAVIVTHLKKYLPFMDESLFLLNGNQEEEEEEDKSDGQQSSISSSIFSKRSSISSTSSNSSVFSEISITENGEFEIKKEQKNKKNKKKRRTRRTSFCNAPRSIDQQQLFQRNQELKMPKGKNVSMMRICLYQIEALLRDMDAKQITYLLNYYVNKIFQIIKIKGKGMIHQTDQDEFLISFNCVNKVMEHEKNAVISALRVLKEVKGIGNYRIFPKCAICSGAEVYFGVIGGEKFKKFQVIGQLVDKTRKWIRKMKEQPNYQLCEILTHKEVLDYVKQNCLFQKILFHENNDHQKEEEEEEEGDGDGEMIMYDILDFIEVGEKKEWMYTLDDIEKKKKNSSSLGHSCLKNYNEAFELFEEGKVNECKKRLESIVEKKNDDDENDEKKKEEQKRIQKKVYVQTEILLRQVIKMENHLEKTTFVTPTTKIEYL